MTARREIPGAAARRVALDALVRIDANDSYANLALSGALDRSDLDERDRGLVTELVYGTLRRRRACDYLVDRFLSSDPPAVARWALRLGAYQLQFAEIPAHAAVSATVAVVPDRLRGLVNAVLRRVASNDVTWPDEATRLSYPDWIVDRLTGDLGPADAMEMLEAMNVPPSVTTRGDGYTQDLASQWVAGLVPAAVGEVVVDLCASPGGKTTALAARGVRVIAGDVRPGRGRLVGVNVSKLGLGTLVLPVVADGTAPPIRRHSVDHVLVDAPCSGLGVLRRRADARWRITAADVDRLVALQRRLMRAGLELVRPGGTLTYSVCTVTRAETVDQAEWLAHELPHLEPLAAPDAPWRTLGQGAMLLPQDADTDGMSIFRWSLPPAS